MYKFLLIGLISVVSACSSLQFPGVYKIRVEQGNVIKQEMVDQLKPGMSRDQVEYIMGTALLKDSFNGDRWDYIYTLRRGDTLQQKHRMSIYFKDGKLTHFSGDFVPSENTEANSTKATQNPKEATAQPQDS